LAFGELADIGHQLIDQDHTGGVPLQQFAQHVLPRRGAHGIRFGDQGERLGPAKLPRQFAPQGMDGLLAALPGLSGGVGGAVEHDHARLGHVEQLGAIQQGRNPGQFMQRAGAPRQMIDRQHGMGLAAAERGLKLDHRLPAPGRQAQRHLRQQQAHAFGDEGAGIEGDRILIFAGGLAGVDGGDVGGELGLLEGAFQDILMGNGEGFSPGFHRTGRVHARPTGQGTETARRRCGAGGGGRGGLPDISLQP
jgi:hypothetical protein